MFRLKKIAITLSIVIFCAFSFNLSFAAWGFGDVTADPAHTAVTGVNTAQQTANTGVVVKQALKNLFQEILKGIAKTLLNKITTSTVNWINGGFEGGPSFVTHPDAFFKDVADTQITTYIDSIAYNEKKFPLGQNTSKALIKNYIYGQGSFAEKSKYTFNTVGKEVTGKGVDEVSGFARSFERDFKVAGSKGFEAQTQNPYNNPFGDFVKTLKTTDKAKERAREREAKDLEQGGGFLSQRKCVKKEKFPKIGEEEMRRLRDSGAEMPPQEERCVQWETKTPGSVVGGQINRALSSKFFQSEMGSVIGGSISQIVNALTSQLINKGLSALSTAASSVWEPKNKNWEYNGFSVAGPTDETNTNNPATWASGPDRVIDLQELLIDGIPLQTEITIDANGDEVITVTERGPTVIEMTKEEGDIYKEMISISEKFPAKLHALDRCDVGPDKFWEARLRETFQRATRKLERKANSKKEEKAEDAQNALDKVAGEEARLLRNIQLKSLEYNLPSHPLFQDQINLTNRYSQSLKQYYDKLLAKRNTEAQLKAIRDLFQTPNSLVPKVELIGRYVTIEQEVSNKDSLAAARAELAKIRYDDQTIGDMDNPLIQGDQSTGLLRRCSEERAAASSNPNLTFIDPGTNSPVNVANNNDTVIDEVETGPAGTQNIPIIPNVSRTDMISYVSTTFSLTNTTKLKVNSTDLEDLVIVYSILKDSASQNSICPGLTQDPLVTCALEYVDANVIDYGKRAVQLGSEIYYYCFKEIQALDLQDVYKRKDIDISCNSFYESNPLDYEINKDY